MVVATDSQEDVKQEVSEEKVEAPIVAETPGGEPKTDENNDWKVKAEAAQAEIARLRKEIGDKERGNARLSKERTESLAKLGELEDKLEALLAVKRREEGVETPEELEIGMKGVEQEIAKRQAARQKEQPSGNIQRPWTPEEHRTFGRMEALGETVGVDIKKVPIELRDVIDEVGELFTGGDSKAAEGKWKEALKTYTEQLVEKAKAKEDETKRKAASVHSAGGGSVGGNTPNLSSRELARQAYSQNK